MTRTQLAAALVLLCSTRGARGANDDATVYVPSKRAATHEQRRANAQAAWESRDFDYTVGLLTGFSYGVLHVDGRKADAPSPFFTFAVEQALAYRVTSASSTGLAVTLVGRLSLINYDDRTLTHTDLGLGPELRLLQRVFRPTVTWRFRVTGGYSLGFQGDHEGRAVIESYGTGSGPSFGTAVVAAMSGPRVGGYFQFGTFHRFLSMDAHAELASDPSVRASTRHEYSQHEILGGGGLLVRF